MNVKALAVSFAGVVLLILFALVSVQAFRPNLFGKGRPVAWKLKPVPKVFATFEEIGEVEIWVGRVQSEAGWRAMFDTGGRYYTFNALPPRNTFDEALADLVEFAGKAGWRVTGQLGGGA